MKRKHYVIIGAGISGLALAPFLQKKYPEPFDLTILEASNRVGGWIQTIKQDNFLFEQGPRSCRTRGTGIETLRLVEELGLKDQIILASPAANKRFLYTDNNLKALPTGPLSLLFSSFAPIILKGIWNDLRTPKGLSEDETIHDFVARRFGEEIADQFIDPLVLGIYAGDSKQLSVKSCFPIFMDWEKKHGSVIKGVFTKKEKQLNKSAFVEEISKHPIFSFKEGMETLIHALAKPLGNKLKLSSPVVKLQTFEDRIELKLESGQIISADHVFATAPPQALAKMMIEQYPESSLLLRSISSTSVAVVNVGYTKNVLDREGFGYLVPSKEKEEILGVVWDSSAFPQQNHHPIETRLTVMIGEGQVPDFTTLPSFDFVDIALRALSDQMGIKPEPDTIAIKMASQAIPQFEVGHAQKIQSIKEKIKSINPRLTLLGSAFDGVSVNDCIAGAKRALGL